MSIATSGDYRNYFEQDGVRYSHTIDPITGRPINHRTVSITVLSPTCMTADGLSTGLNVMGPERGGAGQPARYPGVHDRENRRRV